MEYLTFHLMASGLSKGRLVLQGTKAAMSIAIGGCGGLQLVYTPLQTCRLGTGSSMLSSPGMSHRNGKSHRLCF